MESFPCLVNVMDLDWFQGRQQTKSLWSSSGTNFLSLIYYHSSVVSSGRMYGNIFRSCWIYFSRRSLVWWIIFSCAGDVGGYGFLCIEEYCVRDSMSDMYVGVLSWYISVGFSYSCKLETFNWVQVACIPSSHTCMVYTWINMWLGCPPCHIWWEKWGKPHVFALIVSNVATI